MIWVVVTVFALYVVAMIGFSALPAARRLKQERWSDVPADWKLTLVVFVAVGLVGDALFNVTRAVVIFKSLPRDLLFSGRIQRRVNEGKRDALTQKWVRVLNAVDDQHIKTPPGFPGPA